MIKAIIFDFDGVVVESVDIKTEAFRELFQQYPQHLDAILQFHLDHGGISRQEKIKHFYKNILKVSLSESQLKQLCDRFSDLVKSKVVAASFVKGAEDLLNKCRGRYKLFVVSGTPEDEMREIVHLRKIQDFFSGVYGSPTKKADLTRNILKEHHYQPNEVVFIGDAITDFNAAKETGVYFIARSADQSFPWLKDKYIKAKFKDLVGVWECLQKLDSVT